MMKFTIQSKIVFPYTLLFAAVIVVTSLITISIVYKRMDERIEEQMEHEAEVISNMGFLLSDDFLSNIRIREVVGADIIVYKSDGEVMATTLSRDAVRKAMAVVKSPEVEQQLSRSDNASLIRNIRYLGQSYKVIYKKLESPQGEASTTFSLMSSTADIAPAKRRSAISIGLVALSGIILVAVVGVMIARSITAPVKQLVKATENIAAGDLTADATVKTRDEIGTLANSFNQMTRELKKSRDKLVQSEKLAAVGELAAGIAHEIRNPLTSIKMTVQLLRRRFQEDEAGRESVQVVLDEINRLETTISDLLDFARPMELVLNPVNANDIMNDVLSLMESDLRHKNIDVAESTDRNLPEAMLDSNRLKQVFMNVILNSMQAMPEGGKLTISSRYDRADKAVRIEISDTGIGMSQEVLEHAFEPFYSNRPGGTGLGLANVRRIVEQHGGEISIESAEGQGTKVTLSFEVIL